MWPPTRFREDVESTPVARIAEALTVALREEKGKERDDCEDDELGDGSLLRGASSGRCMALADRARRPAVPTVQAVVTYLKTVLHQRYSLDTVGIRTRHSRH